MLLFAEPNPTLGTFSFLLNIKSLRHFESQSAKLAQRLRLDRQPLVVLPASLRCRLRLHLIAGYRDQFGKTGLFSSRFMRELAISFPWERIGLNLFTIHLA